MGNVDSLFLLKLIVVKKFILLFAIFIAIISCNNNSDSKITTADSTTIKDTTLKDSTNPASAPVQNAPY